MAVPPDGLRRLRIELAGAEARLEDVAGATRAARALAAAYAGERVISIGFGGVALVRPAALGRMLDEAAELLEPWETEGRIELRSLRPRPRRVVGATVTARRDLVVTALGRRGIVVAPRPDERLRMQAAAVGVGVNRRRMMLLAARDGACCTWCGKPLTHRSSDATVDHVVCRSRGGPNALENLVLACASCNHRRADLAAEAWLARCVSIGADVNTRAVEAAIRRAHGVDTSRPDALPRVA